VKVAVRETRLSAFHGRARPNPQALGGAVNARRKLDLTPYAVNKKRAGYDAQKNGEASRRKGVKAVNRKDVNRES